MDLLKRVVLSSRPWSVTASLSAALVAFCSALGSPALDSASAALLRCGPALLGVVLAQAGANLVNTYADHAAGVDCKDDSGDRTLVDGVLPPLGVAALALAAYAGAGAALWRTVLAWDTGALLLPLAAWGLLLGVLYTARPLALKYLGLGDATVLAVFGPLLVAGAALAALGERAVLGACPRAMVDSRLPSLAGEGGARALAAALAVGGLHPARLWASLRCAADMLPALPPLALAVGLTVMQILCANNVRDIAADARARVCTVARCLGARCALAYFALAWAAAFAAGGLGLAVHLVSLSSPEALSLPEALQLLGQGAAQAGLAASDCLGASVQASASLLRGGGAAATASQLASHFAPACLPHFAPLEDSVSDAAYADRTSRSLFVRGCVMAVLLALNLGPVALELCRRMAAGELKTLPQACAQFSMLFSVTLVACGDFIRGTAPGASSEAAGAGGAGGPDMLLAKVSMGVRIAVSVACLLVVQPAFAAAQGDEAFHAAEALAAGRARQARALLQGGRRGAARRQARRSPRASRSLRARLLRSRRRRRRRRARRRRRRRRRSNSRAARLWLASPSLVGARQPPR